MKKLLLTALSLTLLCACGGGSSKNSRTCTLDENGGTSTITATASDGTNIDKITYKAAIAEENLAETGYGETIEEAESQLELINSFMDVMEQEGLTIDVTIENKSLVTTMEIDMTKVDKDQLAEMGINFGETSTTLDDFVKEAEAMNATCK